MRKLRFEERLQSQIDEVRNNFNTALKVFLADRRRSGCTERTIEWYEYVLGYDFLNFLEKNGLYTAPIKWIQTDIENYIDHLRFERNCRPSTCKNRFTAIRAFCNFLYRKNYLEHNPVAGLAPMKVKKQAINTIPDEYLAEVLKKPNLNKCTFADFRDWAIMWTLFDTGIRVSELVNIVMKDVRLDEGYILITHGKGQKERPVGVSRTLDKILREYIKVLQPESNEDYLFVNSYGEQLSQDTVRKRLHEHGKRIGMEGMVLSPHKFRYTFAKHYIKNGGDPFRLQKALGHSSMEMVRNYVEMFSADVIEAHQEFSPADHYQKRKRDNERENDTDKPQRRKRMKLK